MQVNKWGNGLYAFGVFKVKNKKGYKDTFVLRYIITNCDRMPRKQKKRFKLYAVKSADKEICFALDTNNKTWKTK